MVVEESPVQTQQVTLPGPSGARVRIAPVVKAGGRVPFRYFGTGRGDLNNNEEQANEIATPDLPVGIALTGNGKETANIDDFAQTFRGKSWSSYSTWQNE